MTLIEAITNLHDSIAGQITGGIWLGEAPKGTREPAIQFKPYTEYFVAPSGGSTTPPSTALRERFFALTHTDSLAIMFRVTATWNDIQTLARLLHDTFDGADLTITDGRFLSMLAVHRPIIEDMGARVAEGHLYRATVWFECATQD